MKRGNKRIGDGKSGAFSPTVLKEASPELPPTLVEDLVFANHILARNQILDGYGHVSVRHGKGGYLLSRSLAPALVTSADLQQYDLNSTPVDSAAQPSFLERFIHGEIYRARPDVQAIVHSHMSSVIPFGVTGTTLKPLYHMAAFLGGGVPIFEIRTVRSQNSKMVMLVHNQALGRALTETLGKKPVALMRGHGAVIVGSSLPHVVGRSIYLAINAALQLKTMTIGRKINYLDPVEAQEEVSDKYQRSWELWKHQAMSSGPTGKTAP